MSNTESRVCTLTVEKPIIGFSTVKVTGMIIRGEKSEHKNICRASNETPKNPWTQNSYSEFPILKTTVMKDHTTQEI